VHPLAALSTAFFVKFLPKGDIEKGRAVVRLLAFGLVLCVALMLSAYVVFFYGGGFASTLNLVYRQELDWFGELTGLAFFFLSALLASVSLMLLFGERNRRDVRYGRIGLGIVAVSWVLCVGVALLPARPKARGAAAANSEQTV
jgi:glucan phosphoethanolaminetransferase (alkaline phosphatase superfamily)